MTQPKIPTCPDCKQEMMKVFDYIGDDQMGSRWQCDCVVPYDLANDLVAIQEVNQFFVLERR